MHEISHVQLVVDDHAGQRHLFAVCEGQRVRGRSVDQRLDLGGIQAKGPYVDVIQAGRKVGDRVVTAVRTEDEGVTAGASGQRIVATGRVDDVFLARSREGGAGWSGYVEDEIGYVDAAVAIVHRHGHRVGIGRAC